MFQVLYYLLTLLDINEGSSSNLSRDDESNSNYRYQRGGISGLDHPFSSDFEYSNPFLNGNQSSPPVR